MEIEMEIERLNIFKKYEYLKKLKLEGYLWEFLRRNEDYKKLYNKFLRYSKYFKKLKWYELPRNKTFYKLNTKLNHYGLKYPLDPSKQANEIKDLESYFMINQTVGFICLDDHPDRALYFKDIEATGYKGVMLINLKASNMKIISDFEKIIKRVKKNFKTLNKPKANKIENKIRSRTKEWDNYLIAYDLKVKKYKIREIADILLLKQKCKEPHKHTSECLDCKKRRRNIKEAEQLINKMKYRRFIPSLKVSNPA